MAIQSGKQKLAGVLKGMHERAVPKEGIEDVERALKAFAAQAVVGTVSESAFG
jgi:hypothetical protein